MGWQIENHSRLFGHAYKSWMDEGPCDVCTADMIMGRLRKSPRFNALEFIRTPTTCTESVIHLVASR